MRRLYQLFYLILFNFVFGFTNAQNLIYKKIEDEKNKGKVFELVENVFIKTEAISTMNSEFKNKDEVVFMKYNTALYDKLGEFVTIQIPLKNRNITLELQTVENDFMIML